MLYISIFDMFITHSNRFHKSILRFNSFKFMYNNYYYGIWGFEVLKLLEDILNLSAVNLPIFSLQLPSSSKN